MAYTSVLESISSEIDKAFFSNNLSRFRRLLSLEMKVHIHMLKRV